MINSKMDFSVKSAERCIFQFGLVQWFPMERAKRNNTNGKNCILKPSKERVKLLTVFPKFIGQNIMAGNNFGIRGQKYMSTKFPIWQFDSV